MLVGHLMNELVTRGFLHAVMPRGAQPKWYHVVAIVGVCMLVFSGAFAILDDVVRREWLQLPVSIWFLALGIGAGVLVRSSLARTASSQVE